MWHAAMRDEFETDRLRSRGEIVEAAGVEFGIGAITNFLMACGFWRNALKQPRFPLRRTFPEVLSDPDVLTRFLAVFWRRRETMPAA
jgi:hypothetical protein